MEVYTSVEGIELGRKIVVKSYRELSESFVEWITVNTEKLLTTRMPSELEAAKELRTLTSDFLEQPFFMIDGRSYFLDFYIPRYKLAIEIDGRSHRGRRKIDRRRDLDFANIGIRTVRISVSDVVCGKFLESLRSKVERPTVAAHYKPKKKKPQRMPKANRVK